MGKTSENHLGKNKEKIYKIMIDEDITPNDAIRILIELGIDIVYTVYPKKYEAAAALENIQNYVSSARKLVLLENCSTIN